MKRVTFLIFMVSAAALLLCACSSEEGTVSPKPTGSGASLYGHVSGFCVDSSNAKVDGINCEVYVYSTGNPSFSFYDCKSDTDPVYGAGSYECGRIPYVVPPWDGTYLVVKGFDGEDEWGASAPFAWYQPDEEGIIVYEN
ncbi:MAG: hypothetical protein PVH29_01885 [Candidatus Zixiibacteriota bacterium]|jgi:hypothetical protein